MELIAAKCPNCGSDVQVNPDERTTVCDYCGGTIIIKEAIKLHNGAVETVTGEAEKERILKMADNCLKNGFLSEANEKYTEVSRKYPDDYRGWFGIIQCNPVSDHNLDRMENEFKRAIAFAPEDIKEKITSYRSRRNELIELINKYRELSQKIKEETKPKTNTENKITELKQRIEDFKSKVNNIDGNIAQNEIIVKKSSRKIAISLVISAIVLLAAFLFVALTIQDYKYMAPFYFSVLVILLCSIIWIPYFCGQKKKTKSLIKEQLQRKEELNNELKSLEKFLPIKEASLIELDTALSKRQAELDKIKAEQKRLESELASLS